MKRRVAAIVLMAAAAARAEDWLAKGRSLYESEKYAEAAEALRRETDAWPEHQEAYKLLGLSLEKLGKTDEAKSAWKDFRALAKTAADRALADEHLGVASAVDRDLILDEATIAAIREPQAEWFTQETAHFTIKSHNKRLTEVVAVQAEKYLATLSRTFMGGAAYPHKVPLTIHRDQKEYVAAGNPDWSQGGTAVGYESIDGFMKSQVTRRIDLLQTIDGKLNPDLAKPKLLPHELTHLVLGERFGERPLPLWLNEGIAQYMEADRRAECDKLLNDFMAQKGGAPIPLRTLVNLPGYPDNRGAIALFYAQSASFTGWLADTLGPEKLSAFLEDLRKGTEVEQALQSAFKAGAGWDTAAQAQWLRVVKGK
ncbi:MAG: tetratricopeptide repeat protein [Planctomycetes bacterium]|nr:tetratricopeptide repeat protein [Planctomycetota bacterium]